MNCKVDKPAVKSFGNSIGYKVLRDAELLKVSTLQMLFLWARKEGIKSGKGFNMYKAELKKIGVFYDRMKKFRR